MAITYKWDIPQMNAHIQADGARQRNLHSTLQIYRF